MAPAHVDGTLNALRYVMWIGAVVLGWRFRRSRAVFAAMTMGLFAECLDAFGAGAETPSAVFHAVSFVWALNIGLLALIRDRSLQSNSSNLAWLVLVAELVWVWLLGARPETITAHWLVAPWTPYDLTSWSPLAEPAFLTGLGAMCIAGISFVWRRDSVDAALIGALLCAELALHHPAAGVVFHGMVSAGLLILLLGVTESSYGLAFHDELTGLPGRRALNDALNETGSKYTIAMVDIDHFKSFNDNYGHDAGDDTLRMVASKLALVSGGGVAYRYGGEEFTLLYMGRSMKEALPHIEKVRESIANHAFAIRQAGRPKKKPRKLKSQKSTRKHVEVTISIGVAEPSKSHRTAAAVIKAADKKLYAAKEGGRNRVES